MDNTSAWGDNGLPVIGPDGSRMLRIQGHGATIRRSAADGVPMFRIFYVDVNARVSISDLTVSNGLVLGDYPNVRGGGIYNDHGTLSVKDCVLSGNRSAFGGGIYNDGDQGSVSLEVTGSTFSANVVSDIGGAILNSGYMGKATALLSKDLFTGNWADFGGGLQNYQATMTLNDCTFSGNSANYFGAILTQAIFTPDLQGSSTTVNNCTFSANSATFQCGAIGATTSQDGNATTTIRNSTLSGNSAGVSGATILINGTQGVVTVKLKNTTLADNTAQSGSCITNFSGILEIGNSILQTVSPRVTIFNDSGTVISDGYNISRDNAAGFFTGPGDQINTDPKLDPAGLQNNGGWTQTIALLPVSPAINAGNDGAAPRRDQRGYFRNGRSDVGAFEYQGALLGASSIARNGDNIVVGAEVVRGKTYRLERKLSLTDPNWQNIPGVLDLVAIDDDTESITDPNAFSLGKALYRVRLLP